jgi:hypothetical protein
MPIPLLMVVDEGPGYVDVLLNSNSPFGVTYDLVNNMNGERVRSLVSSDSPVKDFKFRVLLSDMDKGFKHISCKQVPNG